MILISKIYLGAFPAAAQKYQQDLEYYLRHEIKVKTNLEIDIKNIIFAKTYPEKKEFLSIYYLCYCNNDKAQAGEKFAEVKWIKPSQVKKYFTTSIHPFISKFLKTLN